MNAITSGDRPRCHTCAAVDSSVATLARFSRRTEEVMKLGSMLCIALFAASMPVTAQETGTLKKLRDTGEIVLGVRDASIPFSYADDSGKSIGYSVDLCMRVVDHLRQTLKMPALKVRQQLVTSANRVAAFSEDDILLAGLAASSQTPTGFRLITIDGMLADPYALMMRRDDPQFKAAVDAGLREVFASAEI